MLNAGRGVLIFYALAMLIGGVMGYATKGSLPSLIAGIVSAILLFLALMLTQTSPRMGFGLGVLVAVALAGVFLQRYQVTQKVMPSLALCAFSVLVAFIDFVIVLRIRD